LTVTNDALPSPDLTAAAAAVAVAQSVVDAGIAALTRAGGPDEEEVLAYDVAHAAAAVRTADAVLTYGAQGDTEARIACAFAADALADLASRTIGRARAWGVAADWMAPAEDFVSDFRDPAFLASLADEPGPRHLDADFELVRETFHRFADEQIRPRAEHIHRANTDIPEEIIAGMAEMGGFGMSVPEEYGGFATGGEADYMGMVVATEELSWGSLGAGGSLITRPEILTRALVHGGTEEQKQYWLPRLATAEVMGAVAVTEPDFGSDVAGVLTAAVPTDGGWLINGVKTWCTFAARADVLMLLARTDPDRAKAHRGLSLFVVEKPRGEGRGFLFTQRPEDDRGNRRAGWRGGPSTPWATGACTPTRWPSRTGSCPTPTWWAGPRGWGGASTCRCRGSRTAGCRRPPVPSASCRPPTRRPSTMRATGWSSERPSSSTS
jgi:(2S)-methylsuccinyl-CoA dehydrogenase